MKMLIASCCCLLLTACAMPIRPQPPATLFDDASYGAPPAELAELDPFAISPAMHEFLIRDVPRYVRANGAPRGLYEAIRAQLKIDYDAAQTRTAAQTFDAKAGNCLSLVLLTAALARELHVDVRFRYLPRMRTWTRTHGMVMQNGHVNIELTERGNSVLARPLVVDFVPTENLLAQTVLEIDESTLLAMYLNNRAAETLAGGDVRAAYWWARAALREAPAYAPAYNTLGVIYLARQPQLAERVFRFQLANMPEEPTLLGNLAVALDRQGRTEDAAQVRQQLAALTDYRPFEFLDQGKAAFAKGDARTAMRYYRKELRHLPYSAELHYAIAVASAHLGDERGAREHLREAMQLSANLDDRDLYAGKLEKLRALHAQ